MPIDKSMSLGEIIKKEMAAGKPRAQAEAIAFSVKGEDRKGNDLSWRDRLSTLNERAARGTAKYASKKNVEDKQEMRTGEDDNIEGHGKLEKGKEFQNEDEASQEEHEIQMSEVLRKKEKQNSVIVRLVK